ncbi:MAG TPA: LytTR family DNA-binding domain-containing protein [Thermoanaerobaculia bacterium]|nr:LytTR family DNA-binding domain-containing protein [Thermoanaerobaculia bacterium]
MAEKLRVLIADDEPLARQRIEDLLAKEEDIEIAGSASTGNEAITQILDLAPDILFLDVQMPDKTGVEVAEEIGADAMPVTVFITAFSQFALDAFDVAAVDYLVKPFDDERFAQALQRARKRAAERRREIAPKYADRIAVDSRGQTRVVPVARIDYITASGPYAELHVGDKTFAVRERMQTLEERLDPAIFFRVHRSAIVRLDRIESLLHRPGGDYALRLKDGTELDVSRARRDELQERLGIK